MKQQLNLSQQIALAIVNKMEEVGKIRSTGITYEELVKSVSQEFPLVQIDVVKNEVNNTIQTFIGLGLIIKEGNQLLISYFGQKIGG